jgi:hypothetical protein
VLAANLLVTLPIEMCPWLVFATPHLQVQEGHTVNNWLAATGPVAFSPFSSFHLFIFSSAHTLPLSLAASVASAVILSRLL